MIIDAEIEKISTSDFFSSMGAPAPADDSLIYIKNVCKVFINPSEMDFQGCYKEVEWLPSSPSQEDPFYPVRENSAELTDLRMKVTKAVMASTRPMEKKIFLCGAHDFSVAARNAICFAFRQYISEQYYSSGNHWKRIVDQYYAGRWPVGYCEEKLVLI